MNMYSYVCHLDFGFHPRPVGVLKISIKSHSVLKLTSQLVCWCDKRKTQCEKACFSREERGFTNFHLDWLPLFTISHLQVFKVIVNSPCLKHNVQNTTQQVKFPLALWFPCPDSSDKKAVENGQVWWCSLRMCRAGDWLNLLLAAPRSSELVTF